MSKTPIVDSSPTLKEWPVRIWEIEEIPDLFAEEVRLWMQGPFQAYDFVYAPKRRTNPDSYTYLFGYGKDQIFFMKEKNGRPIRISRRQIVEVSTERELLNAKITVHYQDGKSEKALEFPYVPSVYYLYDPFLNWLLGLEKKFTPAVAEQENPRPLRLYEDSLVMFNYSLGAYRLGNGFKDYSYKSRQRRCKWMPWKKDMEEWLEVPMERGQFRLHCFKYLTECTYQIG